LAVRTVDFENSWPRHMPKSCVHKSSAKPLLCSKKTWPVGEKVVWLVNMRQPIRKGAL